MLINEKQDELLHLAIVELGLKRAAIDEEIVRLKGLRGGMARATKTPTRRRNWVRALKAKTV